MADADQKSKAQVYSTMLKDIVAASRDGVIFLVLLLLLFTPRTINERLVSAGFKKGSFGGLEWEAITEQTKSVGQAVSQADETYKALVDRLGELEMKAKDPSVKASISKLGEEAQAVQKQLGVADRAVKSSLSAQQQIVAQGSTAPVASSGWIYLGKVTEEKNKWAPGSPQTVSADSPLVTKGALLTIDDEVYLRADGSSSARSSAPILSVLKTGQVVRALEVDYSHAKGGGWFVWVKVQRV